MLQRFKIRLLFLFCLLTSAQALASEDKLTLVLDWFINPDHASLFVAQEKGFFQQQGLEVRFIFPADSSDPPKLVAARQADLAITYEPDLIDQIEHGLPLLAVGTLVQQPLNCLLTLKEGPIKTLADLKNKRIGSSSSGIKSLMLQTMLRQQGLTTKNVELINVRHNLMQALLARKVDAVSGAMRNIEAAQVAAYGQKAVVFLPEENGIPNYSELIFVTNKDKLRDPRQAQVLKRFFIALRKATAYLKAHPQESWQAFIKTYPVMNNNLDRLAWDASLPLFADHPEHISKQEWRAFIRYLRQNGFIQSTRSLSDYLTEIST